jgi:hypothetical protein
LSGQTHELLEQNCPGAQVTPHAPQLKGLVVVSTQRMVLSNGQPVRPSGQSGGSGLHEPSTANDDLDCAVLGELLLEHPASPEYAASAKALTRPPIANCSARQREGIRTAIMLSSPWKAANWAPRRRRRHA